MRQLTNEMIIEQLNSIVNDYTILIVFFAVMALATGIVVYIFGIKKAQVPKRKECTVIMLLFPMAVVVMIFMAFPITNAIQYSLQNNCFEIEVDTIVRKEYSKKYRKESDGDKQYTVYLRNNDSHRVSEKKFDNLNVGDSVYTIIVKNKSGKRYCVGEIFPTKQYQYLNE